MIKNVIIGKQCNLSTQLCDKLDNSYLIGARDIEKDSSVLLTFKNDLINIIFNNFQPATRLNEYSCPRQYIEASIHSTGIVLDVLKKHNFKVNKILYTSSSSVYGDNILCSESDELKPKSLHASLKISNEFLISSFCQDQNINYNILRVFNMYGDGDKFSVINKIINASLNNTELSLINNGNSIRDFIHIKDVISIYLKILNYQGQIGTLNIGTGEGYSVSSIVDYLGNNDVFLKKSNTMRNELKSSVANIDKLRKFFILDEFINVKKYVLERIRYL